ncbi:MAG: hypothetical protein FJ207_06045 [Gemmatimonadetes bacterium]|nr:hypothetical protein [Gemmatimonadota bacterium]
MALTKSELIGSLQNEVRILVHLASKIDRSKLDYRPTPKQRSTMELVRYLTLMGPQLVQSTKSGAFDETSWGAAVAAADAMNLDQAIARIAAQSDEYAKSIGSMSDADLAADVEMFGRKSSKGAFIVNNVLAGHAAYRTQLFCYLKSCGREELNTMNLWVGMDAPMGA